MFSCEFCEIFKNNFFTEHLWATASKVLNVIRIQNHNALEQKYLFLNVELAERCQGNINFVCLFE